MNNGAVPMALRRWIPFWVKNCSEQNQSELAPSEARSGERRGWVEEDNVELLSMTMLDE